MTNFEEMLHNPPKKYRPVPFWSWNEKLDVEETKKQINQMNQAGMGGFFMHARGGLQTKYLSKEWFDNVVASLDESEKLDMFAWGYDENGWPSGYGDGTVNELGLKYQQKYLRCEVVDVPFEGRSTLSNVLVGDKTYHCYYEVNPLYIDVLNGEVVEAFLKSTHEKYWEELKDNFGKLQGFFTDEPQVSRNGIPWSFYLEEMYEIQYGEQIRPHLPKLFYRMEGYEEFRFRYWQLIRDLFTDNFMGTIGKWCKKHDSKLTGHMVLEEDYYEHIPANGCCMPSYEFMDIPGMDHLCRGLPSIQTEMQLTSVANQLGKKQILSETFAACGWNVSFEDLRKLYEHQMVHGINLLCQHLESYSLRGIRKRDYPASLYRHQPWWEHYKLFNDMVSRIGMLLTEGEVDFHILVLHTIESGWLVSDSREEADKYALQLQNVMKGLEEAQLQYHLGESRIIKRYGNVQNGKFQVGTQNYSVVIVPPAKCLDEHTVHMLFEFKKQGGTIIFTEEIPEYINGIKSGSIIKLAENCIVADSEQIAEKIPENCRLLSVATEETEQKQFICTTVRHFREQHMTMYYLCNFDEKESKVTINVKGKNAKIFDAFSGKTTNVDYEAKGEQLQIHSRIPSNGSVIYFVYDTTSSITEKLKGDWKVANADSNSLTLDYCDLYVNQEMVGKNMPVSDVQEKLCSYREKLDAKVVFHFFIKDFSFKTCDLMVETPEIFDIFVNGNKVIQHISGYNYDTCFKTIHIYDYLKEGNNEISLSCQFEQSEDVYQMLDDIKIYRAVKNRLTYDMEIEAVYLTGDFGVFTENEFEFIEKNAVRTKGKFYLGEAPKVVQTGALEPQGFPFFAGSITLQKDIVLSKEEAQNAIIEFEKLPSIVTEVSINGQRCGKIMWEPYSIDISTFAQKGENKIEITLTGSLRNLLGPFHLTEGETHMALPFYFFHQTDIWGWGDGINHKWTDDYSFVQNGIFLK